VTRRAWAKNENAEETIKKAMEEEPKLRVTVPNHAQPSVLDAALKSFKL
jgi:urocanate hydratase